MVIKIHVIQCGCVKVDKTLPFKGDSKNPLAFTGFLRFSKNKVMLPVFTYLIEHPKGNILIDTSWSIDVRENYKKELGITHYINVPYLPEGRGISEILKDKKIDYTILTHLDVDHASGIKDIKNLSKSFYVSQEEYESANKFNLRYIPKMWENINFNYFSWTNDKGPFNKSYDLFKDGTVNIVFTPGHSKGSVSILIKNNEKFVLIVGDCGYGKAAWLNLELPSIQDNKNNLITSLKWIQDKFEDNNCVEILASHDRDIKSHVITL